MRHSHVERPVSSDAAPSAAQIMYGTSDPLVGYAYTRCFRSVAGTPDRIAKAKRLITSSACGPSRCAPTTRSALSSMTTLNIAQVSATRRWNTSRSVLDIDADIEVLFPRFRLGKADTRERRHREHDARMPR